MSVSSRQNGNDHLWSEFLASVTTLVNKQTFETWFKPMRLSSVDGARVTIDCPSKFFVEWVSEHHSDKIQFALRQVIGVDPQVALQNANDAPPEISRRMESASLAPVQRSRRAPLEGERLNPKYVFEEFVVGNNSRMTYAACLAVSERPAQVYNPLFIYGGVGLGKTHLMQGIGHGVLKSQPHARVHYCSAEAFMNEMIMGIRQGNSHEFRLKYRNVDLLLIDDIQFLAGKESTQEEFFHTFNALHGASKQIVVTSDRPPKEIPTLEDRLVSRFEWGLITDIQQPDYETRLAILRKKVERENILIPDDVLALIADSVKSNIRELEGSLVKLLVHASVYKKDVNIEMAHDVLKDFVKSSPKKTSISLIQRIVSQHYRVPVESMRSKVRTARIAFPRQVAIYLAREMTHASLAQIGQRFGGRDHTTVIHACQKISDMVERDVSLRSTISQLRKELST
ncbi:MAG TPA: chromosomal replication initiator protein DnaA [Candidatus Krumholzibacteria bacterium]|nr:chromosomal replication initiator protein DnaA [Candidatus Krumholzibacteria bacterium]